MPKGDKLNAKQKLFVEEYLKDLNATKAAERAGYGLSYHSSGTRGHLLLEDPKVKKAIAEAMKARAKRTQIDADFVVKRLAWLADSNIKNAISWSDRGVNLLPSSKLKRVKSYQIESVEFTEGRDGLKKKVKMRSPTPALEMLARHLGMFGENQDNPMEDPNEDGETYEFVRIKKKGT